MPDFTATHSPAWEITMQALFADFMGEL